MTIKNPANTVISTMTGVANKVNIFPIGAAHFPCATILARVNNTDMITFARIVAQETRIAVMDGVLAGEEQKTRLIERRIVTGKQIGRASCRERV